MTVCRVWRILASTRATDGRNRWSLRLPQWWSCPVVGSPYRCSYDLPVVPGSRNLLLLAHLRRRPTNYRARLRPQGDFGRAVGGTPLVAGLRYAHIIAFQPPTTPTRTSWRGANRPDPLGSLGSAEVRNYLPAVSFSAIIPQVAGYLYSSNKL